MKPVFALLAAALLASAAGAVTIGGPAGPGPAPAPGGTPATPPPPPPSGGAQRQLDAKILAFFVGEWKNEGRYQGTLTQLQVVYRTDGSFAGTMVYTQNGITGTYPFIGNFVVQGITDKRFVLTLYPQGGVQSSAELQIIDQNTLLNPQADNYVYRVMP